jgi:hypothetical protein
VVAACEYDARYASATRCLENVEGANDIDVADVVKVSLRGNRAKVDNAVHPAECVGHPFEITEI